MGKKRKGAKEGLISNLRRRESILTVSTLDNGRVFSTHADCVKVDSFSTLSFVIGSKRLPKSLKSRA